MILSREEKENMVLDLYYNKGYTYKQLTRELRMIKKAILASSAIFLTNQIV